MHTWSGFVDISGGICRGDFDVELGGVGRWTMEWFHWHIGDYWADFFVSAIHPKPHHNGERRSSGYRFLPVSEDNRTIKPLCACLHHLQARSTFNGRQWEWMQRERANKNVIILRVESRLFRSGEAMMVCGRDRDRPKSEIPLHVKAICHLRPLDTTMIQWLRWNQNDLVFRSSFLFLGSSYNCWHARRW